MVGTPMSGEERSDRTESSTHDAPVVAPEELRRAVEEAARERGWRAAADVIQRHWDLYATRLPGVMLEALKGMPGEVFVERPSMLVAADYLQQVASGQDAGRFHDGAGDLFGGAREPRELLDSLIALTARAAGARSEGALDTALMRALEARRMLDRADESSRGHVREALPHLMFQWGRCRDLADADGAIAEYERSYDLATITNQTEVARRAAGSLAWLLAERGRLSDARSWLAKAHATHRESPRYDGVLYLTAALVAADAEEYDGAERELERIAEGTIGEYWAALLWVRANIARGPLAPVVVRHAIVGEMERRDRKLYVAGANRRCLLRAAFAVEPEAGFPSALDSAAHPDDPGPVDIVRRAQVLYRAKSFVAGRAQARAALASSPSVRDEAAAQLVLAASEFALGSWDAARTAFRRAHALISHEGLSRSYRTIAETDLRALADLSGTSVPDAPATEGTASDARDPASPSVDSLTRRERELLALIGEGLSFADIAGSLFISPNTVKTLTRNLYRKLGVHSRAEAVARSHDLR